MKINISKWIALFMVGLATFCFFAAASLIYFENRTPKHVASTVSWYDIARQEYHLLFLYDCEETNLMHTYKKEPSFEGLRNIRYGPVWEYKK